MKRYIRASEETAWIVTFGQDAGDAESGPIIHSGEYLIYAVSEDEACRKFEDEYAYDLDGYEGCWARRATQEEIDEWYAYMNEPEDLPFSSTRTNKKPIKSAQGKQRYKFKFEISQVWYEDGETVGDTWQEFAYATAENPLNARIKIENRLEKEYGSKNDEWELVLKVIEGPDGYDDDMKYSSREGYIESSKSIKASEFIVTVGDVEEYYIEADNEDDALQEFLDQYAKPEDLEEYEEDPSYIWVRESEDD